MLRLIWVLLLLAVASPALAVTAPPVTGQGIAWPQDSSDLTPDPKARYGRLPNGMTYVLYRNTAKARGGAVRLRIAAGSMQERDDQRGLAHFVEHMAFNGSTNIAEGDLTKILAREGFSFGTDANAFTDYETTDYVLNLPGNDTDQFETALFIFREIAGNLTFAQDAIERERGVILSEERMRASPQARSQQAFIETAYAGQLYTQRNPIGSLDIIRTAPRQAILDYYQDFYRPENATLIVVGDFDLNAMEKRIREHFGDWTPARKGPPKQADYGSYKPKGLATEIYTEKNLFEQLTATWVRPYIDAPDATASRTRGITKFMATWILNRRYSQLAQQADSPYLSASVTYDNDRVALNTTSLSVVPKPGQDKAAFVSAVKTLRQFISGGATPEEVQAFLSAYDAQVANQVKTEQTQYSDAIADDMFSAIDDNGVYNSAAQNLALWQKIRPQLTVEASNLWTRWLFTGDGPLLARQGSDPAAFTADDLKAAWAEAEGGATDAWTQSEAKPWPYTDFGPPVKAVSKTHVDVLNYDRFTYPNGVVVNIKSQALIKNQVLVSVRFAGGYRLFSPKDAPLLQMTKFYDVSDGGLGRISPDDAAKALSDKTFDVQYDIAENGTTLTGTTTTDSFATQMQVLMAYVTDPGYRPDTFTTSQASLDYVYDSMMSDPSTVLNIGLSGWLNSGDPRPRFPTRAEMKAATLDQLKAIMTRTMSHVPVEVTIAGDISEASALKMIERTFATLPPVPDHVTPAPDADQASLPSDRTPQVWYHEGRDDQEVAFAAFPATDALSDVQATRGLALLAAVFDGRLNDELREKKGATYDSQVQASLSDTFKGFGYLWAQATIKPESDKDFYDAVTKIAADLAAHPVTADELNRARAPLVEALGDKYKNNEDWLEVIPGLYGDNRLWAARVSVYHQYMDVTTGDIQKLAQQYLKPDTMLRAKAVPATK